VCFDFDAERFAKKPSSKPSTTCSNQVLLVVHYQQQS